MILLTTVIWSLRHNLSSAEVLLLEIKVLPALILFGLVAAYVIRHLPPLLRADCRDAKRDPDQVGLAIADLLADDGTGKRKQGWRNPEAVLRAVLRELGHPKPENVTRT